MDEDVKKEQSFTVGNDLSTAGSSSQAAAQTIVKTATTKNQEKQENDKYGSILANKLKNMYDTADANESQTNKQSDSSK
jgi:hypothetical protein